MKLLVLGGGGREAAVVWKILQSARVEQVYCAPGNAGIARMATCLDLDLKKPDKLAAVAKDLGVNLTVCGPEQPLVMGVADAFNRLGLRFVGPSRAAACLEGSKVFAKEFMSRHHIPTATFAVCETVDEAKDIFDSNLLDGFPVVVKADGLAAGKGVFIAQDREQAMDVIQSLLVERKLGDAGRRIVLEACLSGVETSFLIFTDGKTMSPLVPARDYKRIGDGDTGPNTGGMGAYSSPDLLDASLQRKILRQIVQPTLTGLQSEGTVFKGVLYVGLMLTEQGPKVLEYNARLGDPEAQVILPRLKTPFVDVLASIADGTLDTLELKWSDESAVCVVLASEGYPETATSGCPITGIEKAELHPGVLLFHAATKRDETGQLVTSGGRVIGVTALGDTLAQARQRAYAAAAEITFPGKQYRTDIASPQPVT
ncbi:MAG: phosphoribosylamine--glycine ligase [Chloracidobacterium sp.]|uniref:Phosphoribosylamine--glycine ligase n=1 Tax=Chloracidobacterium validum TaxID=2821543 RepID=A0ABX8BC71_9BACT|nr:phosphoribosylamine--glycine ligase [Chloracidobacterium validum]QUW03385.1 phosphoribosylamine--glycine ligase [Chloracidobacterium validum]